MNTRSLLLSALIAGAVLGTLANLPVLNFINCFLCLWVWLGGIFAVYLYNRYERNRTPEMENSATPGQGAGIGALAGVVGAFIGAVVYALTSFITTPLMQSAARALDVDLPSAGSGFVGVLIGTMVFFFMNIILYPLFGAVGGLLGAGVFWKRPQA
jgi:hypothetical protein